MRKFPDSKRLLFVATFFLLSFKFANGSEPVSLNFGEQTPFKQGNISLSATIQVKSPIERGKNTAIHIALINNGADVCLYNLHFNRLIASPAGIILFDRQKHFVADVFDFDLFNGSHATIGGMDWSTLKKGEGAKIDDLFSIPSLVVFHDIATNHEATGTVLGASVPSGSYYIQLVYWRLFVSAPFSEESYDSVHHNVSSDRRKLRQPLFRSNAVQVDVK